MKKTNSFKGLKTVITLLILIFSFYYVKGNIRLAMFFTLGLAFTILSIFYTDFNGFETIKNIIKFFVCFLNITSLVFWIEYVSELNYFDSLLKTIYGPIFEKGVETSIFMVAIFIVTTLVIIGFNRLNLGEDDGEQREKENKKEEDF